MNLAQDSKTQDQDTSLQHISRKQLNELEIRVQELIALMRKAKLNDDGLLASLKQLEQRLADTRRERFDQANSEYRGY